MLKKILVSVDGSHASRLAMLEAIEIAQLSHAEIKAIFIVDDSDTLMDNVYIDRAGLLRSMTAYGQDVLDTCRQLCDSAGVPCVTEIVGKPVMKGRIAQTILAQAAGWHADLIALGTHGRRGLARLVVGSVAQGVVSASTKPVLLMRSGEEDQV
ncbi:universal stress protein [Pandoraea commovens]|uniref:Universal stress protein n=2 Tax=Pandoraea commovens TaxID=2508289 RepID=A0ABY5QMP9_9BURK|nr:universal stress protein [Pandoraea commovens]UVA81949.1 universal stress protein [Pandoraea commovens]